MKIGKSRHHWFWARPRSNHRQKQLTNAIRTLLRAMNGADEGAATFIVRAIGALDATRVGARETTSALQALPDSTLGWLSASSVGLGTGFYLAGAPRLAILAGIAPALLMGAAMVLRPLQAGTTARARR